MVGIVNITDQILDDFSFTQGARAKLGHELTKEILFIWIEIQE